MSMRTVLSLIFVVAIASANYTLTPKQKAEEASILSMFNPTQLNNISNYTVNPTLCMAATFYYQDTFKNYSQKFNDTKYIVNHFAAVTKDLRIVASYCQLDGQNYTWLKDSHFGMTKKVRKQVIEEISECQRHHKGETISEKLLAKCLADKKKDENDDFFSLGGLVHDGLQLASDVYHTASSISDISEGIDHISEGLETAGVIDAAGGGPEDPVGDVIAAVVGGVEVGYGVYQVVKGTIDTVEDVKKTVNDVKHDFSGNENSESGNESGNGESEASFMSFDEAPTTDLFMDFVQNWLLL